ncbi:MAG TPA: hypothetical protein VFK30_14655 [Anaerolineae bacterium]|nr:hypothetical protein [Anaerolineae bacterium]
MQGRLTGKALTVSIETECAHCRRPIGLTLDQDLRYRLNESDAAPLVFEPDVNWTTFNDPNIIQAY